MSDVRITAAGSEESALFSHNKSDSRSTTMNDNTDDVTGAVANITINGEQYANGDLTNTSVQRANRCEYSLLVAPVLRVEELKEEESGDRLDPSSGAASSCSSLYGTDDEAGLSGNASDVSAGQDNDKEEDELGETFVIPKDELKNKIIAQVEFYFSDANIVCDAFMLKHVKRNKLGYVSLKLISSFRKVKSLTKDHRVVAYCLRQSSKLELNEEGTKVRRVDPLPEYDQKAPSRTVVVFNLPTSLTSSTGPSVESVGELFSGYGEISLVRVLRPGKPLPPDVKRHVSKHPELQSHNSYAAVVEFETPESALAASNAMTDKNNWRTGLRVVLLQSQQQGKGSANSGKKGGGDRDCKSGSVNKFREHGGGGSDVEEAFMQGGGGDGGGSRRRSWNAGGEDSRSGAGDSSENRRFELELTNTKSSNGQKGRVLRNSLSPQQDPTRLSPCHSTHSTPKSSPKSSPRSSPTARRKSVPAHSPLTIVESVSAGNSPSQSPWVQRRLKAAVGRPDGAQLSASAGNSPGASPNMRRKDVGPGTGGDKSSKQLLNVVRQPRGPDGSRGFQGARTDADESSVNESNGDVGNDLSTDFTSQGRMLNDSVAGADGV